MAALGALNPRDILSRGYAICSDDGGRVLRTTGEAVAAGRIEVTFHDGAVRADVKEKA
jgi:exonuclease VII large subunit